MVFFLGEWCRRAGRRRRNQRQPPPSNALLPVSKAIPEYTIVKRTECPLLELCWNQEWAAALARLEQHPAEAFCKAEHSQRTALHLATIPGVAVSADLLIQLLEINPHAVMVEDRHKYGGTPLHFACGNQSLRENVGLIRLFVRAAQTNYSCTSTELLWSSPRRHSYSPLYLAARRRAPVETLQVLVEQASELAWVVPWTGGETYHESIACGRPNDSPLEALWNVVAPLYFVTKQQEEEEEEMILLASSSLMERVRSITKMSGDSDGDDHEILDASFSAAIVVWRQCLVLLLGKNSTSSTLSLSGLVERTCCLYHPIPSLLFFVCHLLKSQYSNSNATNMAPTPLLSHALRHDKGGAQEASIRVLMQTLPSCLLTVDATTNLYPAFLAATNNVTFACHPLSLVYDLLRQCPQVVSLQRQQLEV